MAALAVLVGVQDLEVVEEEDFVAVPQEEVHEVAQEVVSEVGANLIGFSTGHTKLYTMSSLVDFLPSPCLISAFFGLTFTA